MNWFLLCGWNLLFVQKYLLQSFCFNSPPSIFVCYNSCASIKLYFPEKVFASMRCFKAHALTRVLQCVCFKGRASTTVLQCMFFNIHVSTSALQHACFTVNALLEALWRTHIFFDTHTYYSDVNRFYKYMIDLKVAIKVQYNSPQIF